MLSLSHLLSFQNANVLSRYARDYPTNHLSAEEALSELIKFFWLSDLHQKEKASNPDPSLDFTCMMHEEMRELDDMWHTFLLFTKEYHAFCRSYFGYFIHHSPFTEEDKRRVNDRYMIDLERFLSYLYDKLGQETVMKWFKESV
jgi:hypothetical protein